MSKASAKIIEGLNEALAHARGELGSTPAWRRIFREQKARSPLAAPEQVPGG